MSRASSAGRKGEAGAGRGRPRIAITLGDPRGIGPEVAVRAALQAPPLDAELLLVGPEGVAPSSDLRLLAVGHWRAGLGAGEAGRISALAIERAVDLVKSGEVDAIVTAPISKPALAAAGYSWPGHTEMLRDLSGARATALCLAAEETALGGALRIVLVTGHVALREVAGTYTVERLCGAARLAHDGLRRWWGIDPPRLAVCAFNPHASDHGLFGDEEARICEPAIERLREEAIDVSGPFPADTVFRRALRGEADAVLAPYHDVGMAAIKTAAFGRAVNVTLGLPFPRTSPDHGTAFDIAGSGRADHRSMRMAIEAAAKFAGRVLTLGPPANRLANE